MFGSATVITSPSFDVVYYWRRCLVSASRLGSDSLLFGNIPLAKFCGVFIIHLITILIIAAWMGIVTILSISRKPHDQGVLRPTCYPVSKIKEIVNQV